MAEPVTVARPYAEAIFRLGRESSTLAAWSEALALIEAVVHDREMHRIVGDPNVDDRQLESLILGVIGDKIDGAARNLVQTLIQNKRLELITPVKELFEDLKRDHEGTLEAKIITALPITDDQVRQLVARLESSYKRKVKVDVEVDPQLIGGVKIVVGDKVIDATVRGRLEAMAAALTS
jgi:F-type H+-transporting ATPase subunit delta